MHSQPLLALLALSFFASASLASASQSIQIEDISKVSAESGGFVGPLARLDLFGASVAEIGDLDGDGVSEIAVGAPGTMSTQGNSTGKVWILFLDLEGDIRSQVEIGHGLGGFPALLDGGDRFGKACGGIGDLNGDGVPDLAVGARGDDDGNTDAGAVWILFLRSDGTVISSQKISATSGGFAGALGALDSFGGDLANIGDVNGDGVIDLGVGAAGDDDGGTASGALWILFLSAAGTVVGEQKISATAGSFGGDLGTFDEFGSAVVGLGDLNRDGFVDIAVGAQRGDIVADEGEIWILLLDGTGNVINQRRITQGFGGFSGTLDIFNQFGSALACLGDVDGDGTIELAVGAHLAEGQNQTFSTHGAVWVLSLDARARVEQAVEFDDFDSNLAGKLETGDNFGTSLTTYAGPNGAGSRTLLVGASGDDDGDSSAGAYWVLEIGDGLSISAGSDTRNGTDLNPILLDSKTLPMLGSTWTSTVTTQNTRVQGSATLFVGVGALRGLRLGSNELLVDPTTQRVALMTTPFAGNEATFYLPIPNDLQLDGLELFAQARMDDGGVLTNALDLTLGN